MATFERGTSQGNESQQYQKYPLTRLEPAIRKFLRVIQIDLDRLHRHKLNVERFNQQKNWNSLHTEQINATRTVQQIKANITEIEKSRLQVRDEDLKSFDSKIETMKEKALQSVREFIDMAVSSKNRNSMTMSSQEASPDNDLPVNNLTLGDESNHGNEQTILLNDLPENTEVVESWENLQENLEELNSMIHQFATLVDDQQEKIDNIENNIESAQNSVNQGAKQLGKALNYKTALFPVAGAVIGTVIAGPVGLFAGAKIGGVLGAVGGGTFGFVSGKFLKGRSDQATEIELSKLSRSNSSPDIHQDSKTDSFLDGSRKRYQSTTDVETSDGNG